jgi:sugar phosphate isomerase/epimerase
VLSITTDYRADTGCPAPYLRRIAETGFTHIHWCHHWNTDFAYDDCEVAQIAEWLDELRLQLLDLHASSGREKAWGAEREYERRAGVGLVANRIEMCARLGGRVIVMHLPGGGFEAYWPRLQRSLDELLPVAKGHDVQIALENGGTPQSFDDIERVLDHYGPDYMGLCYDCGHGNHFVAGLDRLEAVRDRLISVHLHDNDGTSDQHRLPFTGTVDWGRLAGILARSSYQGPVSMEVSMRNEQLEEGEFLEAAFEGGSRLAQMIDQSAQI